MAVLHPGDPFPQLTIAVADDGKLVLPDVFGDKFGVVLFFRGSWCPYCIAQLRAFQRARDDLAGLHIGVVALSVDDEATTAALVSKLGLTYPVGHSADARMIARRSGAFVNADPLHLQSTGFVLDPKGDVVVSVYSSSAIGKLVPDDVIGLVHYLRPHIFLDGHKLPRPKTHFV